MNAPRHFAVKQKSAILPVNPSEKEQFETVSKIKTNTVRHKCRGKSLHQGMDPPSRVGSLSLKPPIPACFGTIPTRSKEILPLGNHIILHIDTRYRLNEQKEIHVARRLSFSIYTDEYQINTSLASRARWTDLPSMYGPPPSNTNLTRGPP